MFLAQLMLACTAFVEEPKTVRLPTDWSVGTAYHVEFTKTREVHEEGQPTKRDSSRTLVEVEVIAKRDDGYTVRWTLGRPVFTSETPMEPLVERVAALAAGLKLDMLTDKTGSLTQFADPSAIDAHFTRAAKLLLEEVEARKSLAAAEFEALKQSLHALKGPNLKASYLNSAKMFYMPAGAELSVGEKRAYEDLLPNPYGGDPLPSNAYLVLTKVDATANEAVVDWRQTIDPVRAGPILEASVRAELKLRGQDIPPEIALSFDAIEDASTWVYDLKTGIPKSVMNSRTSVMGGQRRIDSQEFVFSAPAPK